MTPADPRIANALLFRIAQQIPGVFFYAKVALSVLDASRMCRQGIYSRYHKISSSLGVLKALQTIGVDLGVENLAAYKTLTVPCVFVSNHMSVLETFLFPCLILPYRGFTFVLKRSLTEYPIFKHIIRSLNPIVVDRANPREDFRKVLADGMRCLTKNISVLIFPQTTRNLHFNPKNFNSLGIKLARQANVPVIPVAVKTDAWGMGRLMRDLGKIDPAKPVRIAFGDPVYITGNGKLAHQAILDFISSKLTDWGVIGT